MPAVLESTDLDVVDPEELRARIRAELEQEHEARVRRFAEQRAHARKRHERRRSSKQQRILEEIREEERRRLYREKGYRRYVDSNGRESWLPKDEYEWRMRRRKRRDRAAEYRPATRQRRRTLMIYAFATVAAVLIGLLLIR
ncbi:MAG: hypothetical protein D6798_09400 [Deltaproteobacteria bacterium]|nr:MAG: hypothetical protein D6798_09400 [Deltaproteobacteria bacterium]